jgi:hypothetical protein
MRRVVRHLLTFCSGVSLLVGVGTCVLWKRSYRVTDRLVRVETHRMTDFIAASGGLWIGYTTGRGVGATDTIDLQRHRWTLFAYPDGHQLSYYAEPNPLGFAAADSGPNPVVRVRVVVVPLWTIMLTATVLPAITFGSRIRTRLRSSSGVCARCGYDLRATPDRCPECGTTPAAT